MSRKYLTPNDMHAMLQHQGARAVTRDQLTIVNHLIEALQVIARDHHDIEDADDSDRPSQKANWAMRASQYLEEVQAEFYEGSRNDPR